MIVKIFRKADNLNLANAIMKSDHIVVFSERRKRDLPVNLYLSKNIDPSRSHRRVKVSTLA